MDGADDSQQLPNVATLSGSEEDRRRCVLRFNLYARLSHSLC